MIIVLGYIALIYISIAVITFLILTIYNKSFNDTIGWCLDIVVAALWIVMLPMMIYDYIKEKIKK